MNCKEIQAVLIDWLDGALDQESAVRVRSHIAGCPECSREAEELSFLLTAMRNSAMEAPDPALREHFSTMLQSELNMLATADIIQESRRDEHPRAKVRPLPFSSPVWRVAAAVILLAGGIGIGMALNSGPQQPAQTTTTNDQLAALQKEVKEMKEVVMFNLIDDESASQRIKGVSYVEGMSNPDQQVINVLIKTLNRDKSINVRLAALYSLARFADNRTVRDSLVASLGAQTDPIIQVVLINLLAEKKESRAIAPIKDIINNKKTMKEVKDAAQKSLKVL
jgi:hypothetical protein